MIRSRSPSMADQSKRSEIRREKKPTCRKYMSRSSPAFWPPERMAISSSLPWPRMSSSVSSSSSIPPSARSSSSSSCTRGSWGPSAFLSPSPSASRSRKYRLKSRSKVGWSRNSLISVAASVDLNVSRSERPTSALAARASSASEGEMRISARRRSPMNSRIRSSIRFAVGAPSRPTLGRSLREDLVQRALHTLEILLVLDQHRQRGLEELRVQLPGVEDHERARPVERLRDRRELAEVHRANLLDGGNDRPGQMLGDFRHLQADDLQLVGRRRKVDEQMQAPAFESVGELPGVVRRQDDERDVLGPHRSELGHRHLEVREHLEQERLELGLGLVDFVDEQDDRLLGQDRREERRRREEAEREERVFLTRDLRHRVGQRRRVGDQLADPVAQELRVEELFGVLPLVERLAFVEPLVALQADERARRHLGQRFCQLGLAHTGRPLDQYRTAHARGQEHDGGHAAARDVARVPEPLLDFLDGLEHGGSLTRVNFSHCSRQFGDFGPPTDVYNAP